MLLVQVTLFMIFFFVAILKTPAKALYVAEGGDVVLTPSSGPFRIRSIVWKHGADFAAEWDGEETNCLTKFEGRCKLDYSNGALTITGLNKADSGIYKPEINYIDHNSIEVTVISHVPQPSVSKLCHTEMTTCNLTCEGNTREAEPVTNKWFADDTEGHSDKMYVITKETKKQSFRCMLLNPVGNKSSEIMTNPLLSDNNMVVTGSVIAGVAVLLLIVVAIVAFFIYRHKRKTVSYDAVLIEKQANHVAEVHKPNTQEPTALSNGSDEQEVAPADEKEADDTGELNEP